ncbi:MAG: hypothetical protein J0H74_15370 [Chitinophagaceae bacterium]|nr:hypothetical protein [Chitinophagaceae bacterium]
MKGPQTAILLLLCTLTLSCFAQDQPGGATAIINSPSKFFNQQRRCLLGRQSVMQRFLKNSPATQAAKALASLRQLQSLQAKTQDADQVREYIRERKQQISQYIQQHTNLSGLLEKDYQGFNQDAYYYSQQVRAYKEMLNTGPWE